MSVLYGLVGKKLSHSFSADFFNKKFEAENVDAHYVNFEIESPGKLTDIIRENDNLRGLNVTVPYKESIMPYLNAVDETAKAIGAVNVIEIRHDSNDNKTLLIGHNTDADGFAMSINPIIDRNPNIIRKALVLGTGGAAKAVKYALAKSGIEIWSASRTPQNGELGYSILSTDKIKDFGIIINATPLGMYPDIDSCPQIAYDRLGISHLCFDLVYNPEETTFLRKAREAGAITKNGLEMLHNQARLAWEIWQSSK